MAIIKNKKTRRILKLGNTTVIEIEKYILPEEISCPEKYAEAKATLRKVKIMDPRFGPFSIYPD